MQGAWPFFKRHWGYLVALILVVSAYFTLPAVHDPLVRFNRFTTGWIGLADQVQGVFEVVLTLIEFVAIPFAVAWLARAFFKMMKHKWQESSRLSLTTNFLTLGLVAIELALVPAHRFIGPDVMAWLSEWAWIPLLVYLSIQLSETASRDSSKMAEFAIDNVLAFVSVIVPFALFILHWTSPPWELGANERSILLKCLGFGCTDLVWGIGFALRIAMAGKERDETIKPPAAT